MSWRLRAFAPSREIRELLRFGLARNQRRSACIRVLSHAAYPLFRQSRTTATTRARSSSLRLEPDGRHRPCSNRSSATAPPTTSHSWKMGWQVHGFPDRTGFDVLCFQGQSDDFSICTEFRWIDGHDCEPAGMTAPGDFWHEVDTGQIANRLSVMVKIAPPGGTAFVPNFLQPTAPITPLTAFSASKSWGESFQFKAPTFDSI